MNSNATNEENIKNDRDLARAMAQVLIERAKAMPEAVEEEEAVPENAPRIVFGHDIVGRGRVSWTIKGVVPKRGIGAIYGPSGSGKTFFVISMMAAIAEGEAWYGHRVKKAPVFLAALEGVVGISQRVEAWEVHTGRHFPDAAGVIMNSGLDFGSKKSVDKLVDDILSNTEKGSTPVLFIDTLAQACGGLDENSPEGMGAAIKVIQDIQRRIDGVVIPIHHTGKDTSKGLRGHSSLKGALDFSILVNRASDAGEEAEKDVRVWLLDKAKDGRDNIGQNFRLKGIKLDEDEDGDEIWSAVAEPIEPGELAPQKAKEEKPLDDVGRSLAWIMETMVKPYEFSMVAPSEHPVLRMTLDRYKELGRASNIGTKDAERSGRSMVKKLADKGLIHFGYESGEDDTETLVVWLPEIKAIIGRKAEQR